MKCKSTYYSRPYRGLILTMLVLCPQLVACVGPDGWQRPGASPGEAARAWGQARRSARQNSMQMIGAMPGDISNKDAFISGVLMGLNEAVMVHEEMVNDGWEQIEDD